MDCNIVLPRECHWLLRVVDQVLVQHGLQHRSREKGESTYEVVDQVLVQRGLQHKSLAKPGLNRHQVIDQVHVQHERNGEDNHENTTYCKRNYR